MAKKRKNSKIFLYGLGNETNFSYYTFEKTKKSKKILGELFEAVFNIKWPLFKEFYMGDKDKSIKIDIANYVDFHERIQDGIVSMKDGSRIDVFYGKDKMFFVIHCPQSKRNEFNKKLKKIVKIPEKTKK